MNQTELNKRLQHCQNNNLCFVSLRSLARSELTARIYHHSLRIDVQVLAQYDKREN